MKPQGPNGGVVTPQTLPHSGQQRPGLGHEQCAPAGTLLPWAAGWLLWGTPAGAAGPVSHARAPGVPGTFLVFKAFSTQFSRPGLTH